jgi:hypothetical protein
LALVSARERRILWLVKRLSAALLIVALLAGGAFLVLDRPWDIESYRVVDDHTLVVTTSSGWLDWTRVTSVTENATSVVVSMRSFRLPLPGTGGAATDFTVTLRDPIGGRGVVDSSTGLPIPRRPG